MSGGSLEYAYRHLVNLADEIEGKLENMEVKFGEELSKAEQQKVLEEINKLIIDLRLVANQSRNLEWWLSGDTGDRTYFNEIKQKTI